MRLISCHSTPLVINSLGRRHTHIYRHTQTHIPMICKGSILRNQAHAGFQLARAWFKKQEFILQILTNSKPTINTSYVVSVQAVALVTSLHQSFIFPRDNLFVSLFSGIHQICIPAFPFNLPMQNGTWCFIAQLKSITKFGHYKLALVASSNKMCKLRNQIYVKRCTINFTVENSVQV